MWDVVATTTVTADETNVEAAMTTLLLLLSLTIVFDMSMYIFIFTQPTFYLKQYLLNQFQQAI